MSSLRWNSLKSERLKRTRGVSFEELTKGRLIAIKRHHARPLQDIMLFEYEGYVWAVPFVTNGDELFLKTLYPSRKYTNLFKRGELL